MCREHNFSEDRVNSALDRFENKKKATKKSESVPKSQSNLDKFF